MKVFFASLTDPSISQVDAHIYSIEEGAMILDALRRQYAGHRVKMRARIKRIHDYEIEFVGPADEAARFVADVRVWQPELNGCE